MKNSIEVTYIYFIGNWFGWYRESVEFTRYTENSEAEWHIRGLDRTFH